MKKLLYPLLIVSLLSCGRNADKSKAKNPDTLKSQAQYLQDALKTDEYKNAYMNIQRVKDMMDSVKKGSIDSTAVIFVYNNSIATPTSQVKTVAQVKEGMKNDTAFLKAAQLKAANKLASADSAKIKH
ncbi:hypothetical protein [Mucilaginibacter sp. BT774]|uniref:hypothetical protein n=1 Tax=Mucilaginibacter sp. BT774 TaxID=3062276 RepID=UPI0026763D91|nr:hypothetical protein [Mucilaginibacter sp. BT774]MDO3627337.1 hypothetical protein [Mucilaginibacter sp. BT774]